MAALFQWVVVWGIPLAFIIPILYLLGRYLQDSGWKPPQ